MRILKSSKQRNFRVWDGYYSQKQLDDMESKGIIEKIYWDEIEFDYRVFASDCKSVEVSYDKEYDMYYTTVTLLTGEKIAVEL